MKKNLLVLLVLLACVSLGFAQDIAISAGVSGNFNTFTTNYKDSYSTPVEVETMMKIKMNAGGAEAFLDATYAQVSVGYASFLSGSYESETSGAISASSDGDIGNRQFSPTCHRQCY